jgi:hypothetical protein
VDKRELISISYMVSDSETTAVPKQAKLYTTE